MTDPSVPDPIAIHRGVIRLTTALRLSTLLPPEQDVVFSILRALNAVDEEVRRKPSTSSYHASLLAWVLDTYGRALGELGR